MDILKANMILPRLVFCLKNHIQSFSLLQLLKAVLGIRNRLRIRMFLGLLNPAPDPLVTGTDPGTDPAPDPSLFS